MLDRRMNDRGKMWRHVYKVSILGDCSTYTRHCKYSTTAFTADQRTSFDGARIIYTSSNHFENSNISMMRGQIRVQTVKHLLVRVGEGLTEQSEAKPKT